VASTTALVDINGLVEVLPGAFVIIACFTVGAAVGQYGFIIWEEIPV
jgi:nitrate reductase NapE component